MTSNACATRTRGLSQKQARYDVYLDRDSTIFVWMMANREQNNGRGDFFVRMRRNIIKYGDGARTTKLYQKCTRSPQASVTQRASIPYVNGPESLREVREMLQLARQTLTLTRQRQEHLRDKDLVASRIQTANDNFVATIACTLELTGQVSLRSVQLLQSIIGCGEYIL